MIHKEYIYLIRQNIDNSLNNPYQKLNSLNIDSLLDYFITQLFILNNTKRSNLDKQLSPNDNDSNRGISILLILLYIHLPHIVKVLETRPRKVRLPKES